MSNKKPIKFWQYFNPRNWVRNFATYNSTTNVESTGDVTPIVAGRQSIPEGISIYDFDLNTIKPDVPNTYLHVLQVLATTNPDLSHAVDNVVTLGSTDYTVEVGGEFTEATKDAINTIIDQAKSRWGAYEGGLSSTLLDQVIVNGATSAEAVINSTLTSIDSIARPNPKDIEFKYDTENFKYIPYQRTTTVATSAPLSDLGLVALNPLTYKYYPAKVRGEKPYGIPPFLSSLESLMLENDMLDNFKAIIRRLGTLGFLKVLISPPKRIKRKVMRVSGQPPEEVIETDAQYYERCLQNLSNGQLKSEIDKGFRDGIMIGYKGNHEIDFQPTTANVTGAAELMKIIDIIKHSAFKQAPSLLGRDYNTSEALGRVLLNKMSSMITHYQSVVACTLADFFQLELVLQGYAYLPVKVQFEAPDIADEKVEQETLKLKIDNANALYKAGVIDATQRANMLGYDTPAIEGNREEQEVEVSDTELSQFIYEYGVDLGQQVDKFNYTTCGGCCSSDILNFIEDDNLQEGITTYLRDSRKVYKDAVKSISKFILKAVGKLPKKATAQRVADTVIATIFRHWNKEYIVNQKPVTNFAVNRVYRKYRGDTTPFNTDKIRNKAGELIPIPKSVFSVIDERLVEYFKNSDNLYLGKFITDDDTVKKVNNFILDEFKKGDIPLITNKSQRTFVDGIAKTLNLEVWKVDRVIKTTVNKMKSYSSINYFKQVGVEKYRIVAVADNRTSDICRHLNGKVFAVNASVAKLRGVSLSQASSVRTVTPFASSVFKDPTEVDTLTGAELLEVGVFAPPFHGNCRTQLIAEF